ncbi:hypothetical protein ZEAMMB73_Zm00001d043214 [Zea mays]|uniref:Uncharacterized protein n=1 Tax=Zea mays TaxID=4577 RepID=A0A1D6N9J6_MAIZE|nr:hypothetical protein ZEAMMB73_Zm00001d043214 [Zea mays]
MPSNYLPQEQGRPFCAMQRKAMLITLKKPSVMPSLSSLADKRSSAAGSGMWETKTLSLLNPMSSLSIDERGFTKFVRAEYLKYKSEGRIAPDGVNATAFRAVNIQASALTTFFCRFNYEVFGSTPLKTKV